MTTFNPTKYKNDFAKEKYDRLNIQVEKGMKEMIEEHRKAKGYKSLNHYINDLIRKDMHADGGCVVENKTVNSTGDNNTITIH